MVRISKGGFNLRYGNNLNVVVSKEKDNHSLLLKINTLNAVPVGYHAWYLAACLIILYYLNQFVSHASRGCLTWRILQSCHASPSLLTNILFVTVGSKFWFRVPGAIFLSCGSFFCFKSHKYCGSEQAQQQKMHFSASLKHVQINCPGYSYIISLSHFSFITTPGIFLWLDEILGDVTHLELPWRIDELELSVTRHTTWRVDFDSTAL
jgi:hypothetical protein